MDQISPDQVRTEIQRFWRIFARKSQDKLEEMYSPGAIVFTGKGKRPEPVMLAIARRLRSSSSGPSSSAAELGSIDVQLAGNVAVASYTYKFHREKTTIAGSRVQRTTLFGRATQVFQLDRSGVLKIVHEHLSAAVAPDEGKISEN